MLEGDHASAQLLEEFVAGERTLAASVERHIDACAICSSNLARAARLEVALGGLARAPRIPRASRRVLLPLGFGLTAAALAILLVVPVRRPDFKGPMVQPIETLLSRCLDGMDERTCARNVQKTPGWDLGDAPGAGQADLTADREVSSTRLGAEGDGT